jgi:aspartyl/asparaginyl-tRNA synthetase
MKIQHYNEAIKIMRKFFQEEKGFTEVPAQSRQSILAACEDPATITKYEFNGVEYPLPQTGQMWLEIELLKNPDLKGVFCITTSYRNEPNMVEGRHEKIFPMFEFESHGSIEDMIKLEKELLAYMGFRGSMQEVTYENSCKLYGVDLLDYDEEEALCNDFSPCVFLKDFPLRTEPFWNMRHIGNGIYSKVDVIMHGMETIGSAERAVDIKEMKDQFYNISDGEYAKILFNNFGETRVIEELNEYLSLDMFQRFGGGIGVTRMVNAMIKEGVMPIGEMELVK